MIFYQINWDLRNLHFFNLYEGIPIQHIATVFDVDENSVVFKTVHTQEIAMKIDGTAYILKDDNFDKR